MRRWIVFAAVLVATGLTAAGSDAEIQFRDITADTGITFRHTYGDEKFSKILKATGSGIGIFDYDGDGDLDLYFVNGRYLPEVCDVDPKAIEKARKAIAEATTEEAKKKAEEALKAVEEARKAADRAKQENSKAVNRLYRNDGKSPKTGNLEFTDVTEKAGVGDNGYGMGCVVADFDNDGDVDLFVTNYGPNVLYRNNGNGTFADVTKKAGVAGPEKLGEWTKWSTNAVFLDYDRDGYLDLWVCNYLAFDPKIDNFYKPEGFPGPLNYQGQPSMLYRNKGDGTFEDVSEKAGILSGEALKAGKGMGAAAGDVNNDGWPDVYEANDAVPSFLWVNQGDGTFKEDGDDANCVRGQGGERTASMHPSMGDYDRDGFLDIFVTDMSYYALYRNEFARKRGLLVFEDVTARTGIAGPVGQFVGWGGFFFDYDNDGWLDIFVATGEAHRPENQPKIVLRNTGGKYVEVSELLGEEVFEERRLSRGAACGDLDNDGDQDVVVLNLHSRRSKGGLPTVLVNDGGNASPWIQIRLHGTRSNRDGIGAKVRITAGGATQFEEVRTSPAYLSSVEARLHFGLGAAKRVDRIEIDWPSGAKQILENITVNQLLTVKEPAAKKTPKKTPPKKTPPKETPPKKEGK